MDNSTILLSICIPTCNGVDYLIENLEVLKPQLRNSNYCVELVISDNGTPDNKYNELRGYLSEFGFPVKLFHHDINIGGRANFAYVVSQACGEYIYLLGDDDIISPNFLDIICPILLTSKYSLVHFNFLWATEKLQVSSVLTKQYEGTSVSCSSASLLSNYNYDTTFMSSIVFLKKCWDEGLKHVRDEYYGYEWYAAIAWGIALTEKPCIFYYFPLCIQRNPPKPWAKDMPIFKYIGQGLLCKDLDNLVPGIFETKLALLKKNYYENFFIDILKDPSYYVKYESLFKQVLPSSDFRKLSFCLHCRLAKILGIYYWFKIKTNLILAGIKKL